MFINRLISEIGVRLRTIGGAVDSSIAIKHKSIISIWATTFRLQSLSLSVHTRIHVIYALYRRGEAMHVHAYTEIRTWKEREREGAGKKRGVEGERERERDDEPRPNIPR